jgi:hypothetical protein
VAAENTYRCFPPSQLSGILVISVTLYGVCVMITITQCHDNTTTHVNYVLGDWYTGMYVGKVRVIINFIVG